ncbi:MAG: alanine/glycine:cation symporter family protein [Thermoplasmata archaeon]|nr:alanine/glycine:cation symporter family protein [Thermoplasmata archaeon]
MNLRETAIDTLGTASEYVWVVALVILIGAGVYFLARLRGMNIIRIRESVDLSKESILSGRGKDTLSAFETFCLTLGTRIGVGNVAGMAAAIVSGGPGAVFWIWVFGIVGSANSFMESTLAQIFKERKGDGGYYSGPAYYVLKGLKSRWLAIGMAALIVVLELVFMGYQSSSAVSALSNAFEFENNDIVFAAIVALAVAPIILGGMKGIARFMSRTVPLMAVLWILVCAVVILLNIGNLGNAVGMIFDYAFNLQAIGGGIAGSAIIYALNRGMFASEAGLGTIASIAGTADVSHPVKQGMVQSLATLIDSLVICTATAVTILVFFDDFEAVRETMLTESRLVEYVMESMFGAGPGGAIVSAFLFLFAFTTIIGNYSMAESNLRFLRDDPRCMKALRVTTCVLVFVTSLVGVSLMNEINGIIRAVMGCVNIAVVVLLSRYVFEAYDDWKLQRLRGVKNPVFHRYALGDPSGVTEWKRRRRSAMFSVRTASSWPL